MSDSEPEDTEADLCLTDAGCEQECRVEAGAPVCYCSPGFEMVDGQCEDVDECGEDNGGCDEECVNRPGSYLCSCPGGYELGEDNHACVDTNECVSNNGHGPCQDYCVNTEGSYYCTCDGIEGSKLASDGHTCQERDMCAENVAKVSVVDCDNNRMLTVFCPQCSHGCYSAQGQAYCTCPEGLQLSEDWRTCEDVDECRQSSPCPYRCVNTPGSYTCVEEDEVECEAGERLEGDSCVPVCEDGFRLEAGQCRDVDECYEQQPCSQLCTNTPGTSPATFSIV